MRKSMSKLAMQPSFRGIGQTHAKWQTFVKPKNKSQMYGTQSRVESSGHVMINILQINRPVKMA